MDFNRNSNRIEVGEIRRKEAEELEELIKHENVEKEQPPKRVFLEKRNLDEISSSQYDPNSGTDSYPNEE